MQINALLVLGSQAGAEQGREAFVASEGIAAIAAAVKRASDPGVQCCGCWALALLAQDEAARVAIAAADGTTGIS